MTMNEPFGILLRIGSGVMFTAMVGCIKAMSNLVPLGQIVFFRSAVALIPLVIYLWVTGAFPGGLRTSRPWGHVIRSCFGGAAMFASFATLSYLPVAEALILSYIAPILMVGLSVPILGESLTPRRVIGVVLGLSGIVVFTWPELSAAVDQDTTIGIGLGLLTALLTAIALIQTRHLARSGEHPGAIAFYFALVASIGGGLTALWGWTMPSATGLLLLCLSGVFGGLAHILMTVSFKHAEAGTLAPFEYLTLFWTIAMGYWLFSDVPGVSFYLATPLIIAGAMVASPRPRAVRQS